MIVQSTDYIDFHKLGKNFKSFKHLEQHRLLILLKLLGL